MLFPSLSSLFLPSFIPDLLNFALDVAVQWELFWPVLWKWWRPGCSPPPLLSTSLKSSSVLWMEQASLAWLLRVLCIVLSKENIWDFRMVFIDIFVNLVMHLTLNLNYTYISECKSQRLKWMNHSQTNQRYSPVKVWVSTTELMQCWSAAQVLTKAGQGMIFF